MQVNVLNEQVCKNCTNAFTGHFCNRCGQREAHRLTISHVLHDMVHVFTHADKGLFVFIPQIVMNPGILAREYIDGKRRIFNPFQYLIFSVGIILFLLGETGFYDSVQQYNNQNSAKLPAYFQQGIAAFNVFVKKYANIITFVFLPVSALFSWAFFKAREHNYAEHFTIQVFSLCQVNTINAIILIGFIVLRPNWVGSVWVSVVLAIFSLYVMYKQIYQVGFLKALWKGILVFVISYCVQFLIMVIGLAVYIVMLKTRMSH